MPRKPIIHTPHRQCLLPKPTWLLPVYIFKDDTGLVNLQLPFWGGVGAEADLQLLSSENELFLYFFCFFISISSCLAIPPLRPKQRLSSLRLHKHPSSWEKKQDVLNPTDLPLHTATWLTALPLCTSPLARGNVTGPCLEKKGAFTKWTTFTGFLFPFPQTPATREERPCCQPWSWAAQKRQDVGRASGRQSRKEVVEQGLNFTTARWMDRYQPLVTVEMQSSSRTETDRAVSASHLPVGTPQQHCASDQRKITSLNIATAL